MVRPGLNLQTILFALISLFAISDASSRQEQKKMDTDWKTLSFVCTREQNPPIDAEADLWFISAKALETSGEAVNHAEMIRLYQKAAERGHYKAMLHLAGLYAHGTEVPRNESKALALVEQAMRLQAPHAYYLMGVMLQQGIGVKQDKTAALSYFRKSADLGNRYGQWAIGDEILDAFAQQPEPDRSRGKALGKQVLECALSQDLKEAGHSLGMEYLIADKDTHTALVYFQKAAGLGNNDSLWKLYSTFKDGKYGLEKDPVRATCYEHLWEESNADPNKRFPDIDTRCPLPPAPKRSADSGQPAPRAGHWRQIETPGVMTNVAKGEALPLYRSAPVSWEWLHELPPARHARTGQTCPWPGYWACEERPSGELLFQHGDRLPPWEGHDVTWRLIRGV
jgi:uncharacterized protein